MTVARSSSAPNVPQGIAAPRRECRDGRRGYAARGAVVAGIGPFLARRRNSSAWIHPEGMQRATGRS